MLKIQKLALCIVFSVLFFIAIIDLSVVSAEPLAQKLPQSLLSPAVTISDISGVFLLSSEKHSVVESGALDIMRNALDSDAPYISMELAMHQVLDNLSLEKIITVQITAENGNNVKIKIPSPSAIIEDRDMLAVYRYYIAKHYGLAIAIGNGPGSNVYIKAVDSNSNRLPEIEARIVSVMQDVFDTLGSKFTSKANTGSKVAVNPEPENFLAAKAVTFVKREVTHINGSEYKQLTGKDLITIGIDVGGKGMGAGIRVSGVNVTDALFPEAENEEILKATDQSLRYRYSFSNDKGGSGIELRNRIVEFVSQLVSVVREKYGHVDAVFVNSAGAPDFANDRFASIGALSRQFKAFGGMEKNMQDVNAFIPELRQKLGVVVGFNNDMTGWAISIAEQAGFFDGKETSRAGAILTGGGIGTKEMNNGIAVAGMNEGGHFIWNSGDKVASFSDDSPEGSFEDWAGSVRGIVNESKRVFGPDGKSLYQKLVELGIEDIDPKHIGLAASGLDPIQNVKVTPELQSLAYQVWDNIEQLEAQYIIFIYNLRGITRFAFGGGTTAKGTGKIRAELLNKYIRKYSDQLKISDQITVELVNADPTDGAAIAAEHWFQDHIANQVLSLGSDYDPGVSFSLIHQEWESLNQISEFSVETEIFDLNNSI